MIYFHPKYKRFCPDTERFLPFSGGLYADPDNFVSQGWLEVVHPALAEMQAYGPGSEVNGKWELSVILVDLETARTWKWKSILDSYQVDENSTVIDRLGRSWPSCYKFAQIIRDRRDFSLEQSGTTISIRDADSIQHVLTIVESTALLTLIGNLAATKADKRDNLLSQIKTATTVAELRNIIW